MTRKIKCVECRHCEMRVESRMRTLNYCVSKKRGLPADLSSVPACGKYELPSLFVHWGP